MTIDTHYIPEEDNACINELTSYDVDKAVLFSKRLEIHAQLSRLGVKFHRPLDTLNAYQRILEQGCVAEKVKMYNGEENIYAVAFEVYKQVVLIINA